MRKTRKMRMTGFNVTGFRWPPLLCGSLELLSLHCKVQSGIGRLKASILERNFEIWIFQSLGALGSAPLRQYSARFLVPMWQRYLWSSALPPRPGTWENTCYGSRIRVDVWLFLAIVGRKRRKQPNDDQKLPKLPAPLVHFSEIHNVVI